MLTRHPRRLSSFTNPTLAAEVAADRRRNGECIECSIAPAMKLNDLCVRCATPMSLEEVADNITSPPRPRRRRVYFPKEGRASI